MRRNTNKSRLGGAVSCHDVLKQYDKAKTRLLHIQTLLPKMPPEVRQPWQDWIKDASATIQQKGPETATSEPGDPLPGTTTVPGTAVPDKVDRATNAKPPVGPDSIPNGGGPGANPGR